MSEILAKSLLSGIGISHSIHNAKLIETHISWLVLIGEFVYKIKKPIELKFLDFSTLASRKFFCEEELRLNSRTAPDIYLDVVPISGSELTPRLGDDSAPFEYAVRMKRFDESDILDNLAAVQKLNAGIISALAREIAFFHTGLTQDPVPSKRGTVARIKAPVEENFSQLKTIFTGPHKEQLSLLHDWVGAKEQSLMSTFNERQRDGFIRECHGDLHLANIFCRNGKCVLFDCLEFDSNLRWIDTACDIAFTIMDLDTHLLHDSSQQLLNEYLELTGDYGLLGVLPYYLVYRAMVKAKVKGIRATQVGQQADLLREESENYLRQASQYTRKRTVFMIMMCGLSGTGKTTIARRLATETSTIHIRSDVERKRLFGLSPLASSRAQNLDIYTDAANLETFERLISLTETIVHAGYGVIVDATFIDIALRKMFEAIAASLGIPWCIVYCEATDATVRTRLDQRAADASEAGFAQYKAQQKVFSDFDDLELAHLVTVNSESPDSIADTSSRVIQQVEASAIVKR